MMGVIRATVGWLSKKAGAPDSWEGFWEAYKAWEYSQCNDAAVWEREPEIDLVRAAQSLAKEDPEAGFRQTLVLAEQGSIWAMLCVAHDYHSGAGVAADLRQSEEWYRRAFEGGCQCAQLSYGQLLFSQGDFERAAEVFQVGVVEDWAPAMYWFWQCKRKQSDTRQTFLELRPLLERGSFKGSDACEGVIMTRLIRG
jgi:hypothetical protein